MALNSRELKSLDYCVWGNVRGLSHSQAPPKTEVAELEQMLQMTV